MTALIITVVSLSISALVWCFIGFAGDLKRPRFSVLLVRGKGFDKREPQRMKTVIEFPDKESRGEHKNRAEFGTGAN